jgi:hypothetical protein
MDVNLYVCLHFGKTISIFAAQMIQTGLNNNWWWLND